MSMDGAKIPSERYRKAGDHYSDWYFESQTRRSDARAELNAQKFRPYCTPGRKILDFGCGDGALLSALGGNCGVEINPRAVEAARRQGHVVKADLGDFAGEEFDVIISNHCLEHVERPLDEIRKMRSLVRPDGLIVLVVPCEAPSKPYRNQDRDFHLYSWSAGNLGNLVSLGGFEIIDCRELIYRWPPRWWLIRRHFGRRIFDFTCRIWGSLDRRSSQVICVARPRTIS